MTALIRIVGPCSGLQTPSLLLHTGQSRILINCGEGIQRCFFEQRKSLSKVSHILFTRLEQETTAGLCGVLLTNASHEISFDDSTVKKRTIIGPRGLSATVLSYRSFFKKQYREPMKIVELNNSYDEDLVANLSLGLKPERKRDHCELSIFPLLLSEEVAIPELPIPHDSLFDHVILGDKVKKPVRSYSSYLISIGRSRGKFLPEKARALGVKSGQDFGLLTKGVAVKAKDGSIVTPEQCMLPKENTSLCLVLDSSKTCVEQLSQRLSDKNLFVKGSEKLKVVYHLSSYDVITSEEYQMLLQKLGNTWGQELKHVFMGRGYPFRSNVFLSSDILVGGFNDLAPDHFPNTNPSMESVHKGLENPDFSNAKNFFVGTELQEFDILPGENSLHLKQFSEYLKRLQELSVNNNSRAKFASKKKSPEVVTNPPDFNYSEPFEIYTLGTGSSLPSVFRNVSCIAVRVGSESKNGVLLDCGEGSLYQLYKALGKEEATKFLIDELSVVFLSHYHADHHLGCLPLLKHRIRLLEEAGINPESRKVIVIAPFMIQNYFKDMTKLEPVFKDSFNFISCRFVVESFNLEHNGTNIVFQTVPVIHCRDSYGICLYISKKSAEEEDHQSKKAKIEENNLDKLKLVYSGDTIFCKNLVEAGKKCDILIHEATFANNMRKEARQKKHSTLGDALQAAKEMNAKATILTHFSQRYAISANITQKQQGLSFMTAYDLMKFDRNTIKTAPSLLTKLQKAFFNFE